MSDDRAARLSEKRNQSREKAQSQASKPSETDKPEQTDKPSETDEPDENDETNTERVKDEQVGTYFYLPEDQRDELRYRYKMLSAEYEREFGEDLEKNRHFYPLLVEYGLDGLDSADAHDVQEMLEGLDY
ncbi:hypothetical protein [Natrinema pallidum]|uniref:DUF8160 domain-containing protein n=1 Tax=Natrinema pallidum DSM 3751 TaxID=1227495 RepID=L9YHR1_9EURY|nr:hypothetical protein [Natrinema pallidum]ELY73241.1 hypothetical protein C487_17605 [Natrinema pallidum DSM 3751]